MLYSRKISGYYYQDDPLNSGKDSILLFDDKCEEVAGIIYLKPDSESKIKHCWVENGVPALALNYSELDALIAALSKTTALLKVAMKETKEHVGIVADNLYFGIAL